MSNKNVNWSLCLPFITASMNDPAVVLALHSLLMHLGLILAWVAYYDSYHPMQQAYSILVQSESSYMRSPYCHYAELYIS